MARICAQCGRALSDGDAFCMYCGHNASDAVTRVPEPQAQNGFIPPNQQPPQQIYGQPVYPQQQQLPYQPQAAQVPAQQRKGGNKTALIVIIAAVVVAALVLVGGFVWPGFFRSAAPAEPVETERPERTPRPARETERPRPTAEPVPTAFVNSFTDVSEGDYFYRAILWAGENGVVSGTEFRPYDVCTRAQAMTFLWRSAGSPEPSLHVSPFTDVTADDYFSAPVLWAFENGVISTASDGQFHPDDTLSRAQAITFIYRAADGSAAGLRRTFADVKEGDWYYDAANWAYDAGVVSRSDTYGFSPDETVNRAQYVTFLYRAFAPGAEKAARNDPENMGFAAYGISTDLSDWYVWSYDSICSDDQNIPTQGYATVASYDVFDSGDGFPAKEGYEWRYVSIDLAFTDENAQSYGYWQSWLDADYYNIRLYDSSETANEDGSVTHTVIYNGVPAEITLWSSHDKIDFFHERFSWAAQVPKGYDGVVVGFVNTALSFQWGEDSSIYDVYTNDTDFALFRMENI